MADKAQYPEHPWRLDTNNRYRDAIKMVVDLSLASLVIPILFLRAYLGIPKEQPLSQVLTWKIYSAWASFLVAIFAGLIFYYASGKWIRLAWGKAAQFFKKIEANDDRIELILDLSFAVAIVAFLVGIFLVLWFIATFHQIT